MPLSVLRIMRNMSKFKISGRWLVTISSIVLLAGLWLLSGHLPQPSESTPDHGTATQAEGAGNGPDDAAIADLDVAPTGDEPAPAPWVERSAGPDEHDEEDQVEAREDPPTHPSDPLIAGSNLIREQWSDADAVGNRGRTAIYETEIFKYPLLRVEETWSGKTGEMIHRDVMVADHLLAAPRPGVDEAEFARRVSQQGFTTVEPVGDDAMRVSFDQRTDHPAELPQRIAALGEIAGYAEPDYLVWPCLEPNDPAYTANKLWGLHNPGGVSGYTAGADIDARAGWAVRNDASSIVVAVTDTGIRYDHEDLADNMWLNPGPTPGSGLFGYNFYDDNADPMDTQGHGTHCAGTIGARGNNGVGLTGVAWNVRLMAVKFIGPNGGVTHRTRSGRSTTRARTARTSSTPAGAAAASATPCGIRSPLVRTTASRLSRPPETRASTTTRGPITRRATTCQTSSPWPPPMRGTT